MAQWAPALVLLEQSAPPLPSLRLMGPLIMMQLEDLEIILIILNMQAAPGADLKVNKLNTICGADWNTIYSKLR